MNTLPDVTDDAVIQAARNLGLDFTESFFYEAALQAGFASKAEEKARELDIIWRRRGYMSLPLWVRSHAERIVAQHRAHAVCFSQVPITRTRKGSDPSRAA